MMMMLLSRKPVCCYPILGLLFLAQPSVAAEDQPAAAKVTELERQLQLHEQTIRELTERYGVSRRTIYRAIRRSDEHTDNATADIAHGQ